MKIPFLLISIIIVVNINAQLSNHQFDSCIQKGRTLQRIDMTPTIGFAAQSSAYYQLCEYLRSKASNQQVHILVNSDNTIVKYIGYHIANERQIKLSKIEINSLLSKKEIVVIGSGCVLKKVPFSSLIH
ncbi:hypothetical protein [Rhizosphaericola mali]|uniref:Uncharacterized protein n=1 Tax=Rhizosphaericola mali TaxID=2545455 RepID=A0A5P2G238_9BACT|nr:hypothetical protein [Rhizosphaericola mali]QES89237.1 hypothetical protein E0W69_011380 [Rhizosphaericola mali]